MKRYCLIVLLIVVLLALWSFGDDSITATTIYEWETTAVTQWVPHHYTVRHGPYVYWTTVWTPQQVTIMRCRTRTMPAANRPSVLVATPVLQNIYCPVYVVVSHGDTPAQPPPSQEKHEILAAATRPAN